MMALSEYKRSWNDKRTYDKYEPVPSDCQEIIDKQIDCIEQAKSYVRSIPFDDEPKSLNPLCEFRKFFQTELNVFNLTGDRVFLTEVQIRELYKIHNNDKVKVNWTRQSGKDTVILSYLVYLATKGKRIFIDARNQKQLDHMMGRIRHMTPDWFLDNKFDNKLYFQTGGLITTSDSDSCDIIFSNDYDYNIGGCSIHRPNFKKVIVVSKELNNPTFIESKINWDEIPGREESFKQKMIESIGLDAWNREFEVNKMDCENNNNMSIFIVSKLNSECGNREKIVKSDITLIRQGDGTFKVFKNRFGKNGQIISNLNELLEVNKMCEEFTASKMRKIADKQNCEADKRMIEKIVESIKYKTSKGYNCISIDEHLSECVKSYFIDRGFKIKIGTTESDREFSGVSYHEYTEISW